ncbi:hypothetical protein EC968_006126, partial [Mortierella alpina]
FDSDKLIHQYWKGINKTNPHVVAKQRRKKLKTQKEELKNHLATSATTSNKRKAHAASSIANGDAAATLQVRRSGRGLGTLHSPPTKRQKLTPQPAPTPRGRRKNPKTEAARAWRRAQNRRQGERDLQKALSRHTRALLQHKREEMAQWLVATKEADGRVALWRKQEQEDEELLRREEAVREAALLLARQDRQREAEKAAEAEAQAKADEEAAKAWEQERAELAARREAARVAAEKRAREEAAAAAAATAAEAEAKRSAEATAKTAAEAEAKGAKGESV